MTKSRAIFAAVLIAALPGPSWAGGAVCAVVDTIWTQQHSKSQAAIISSVNQFSSAITAARAETYRQVVSAIKVMTAQRAATDHQIAATDLKANEANANAVSANMTRLAVAKAYETYGDQGQPPDACDVAAQLSDFNQSISELSDDASDGVTDGDLDVSPGAAPNVDDSIRSRIDNASETTLDVQKSLLSDDASDDDVDHFIENLAGLPIQKVSVGSGGVSAQSGTAGGALQNRIASQVEAYRSPALYSLKYIRAIRRGDDVSDSAAAESVAEHLDWIKARYGGGDDYEAWAASMATKSEPGILKEISRIRSLAMAVRKLREESTSRMTVLMGGMVAQEASQ